MSLCKVKFNFYIFIQSSFESYSVFTYECCLMMLKDGAHFILKSLYLIHQLFSKGSVYQA
jgi:hypothetical protein